MSESTQIIFIVILCILILFSAFFSAAETAYSSVSQSKIDVDFKKGKKSAILIRKHYKSFGWTLSTILICNNLVNIGASTAMTYLFTKVIGATNSVAIIATAVMTPIIVIFGEITPKIIAKKYSYAYLKKICYTIEFLNKLLFPITFPLSKITLQSKITNSETELKSLISIAKKEGVIEENEAQLASYALDLDSTKVNMLMTKEEDIVFVNRNITVKGAKKVFLESGHSRILVKEKNKYVGIIILKDLLFKEDKHKINKFVLETPEISQYVLATKALEEMRKHKVHLLIVKNKQDSKKVVGILTIEDIIELLVGEIYDEHDDNLDIHEIAHDKWTVLGSTKIKNFEIETSFKLENPHNIKNIKQWLQERLNRRIKKGLVYLYKNKIKFKIVSNKNKEETIIEVTKK